MDTRNPAQRGLSRGWRGTAAVTCDYTGSTVGACARGSLAPASTHLAISVFAALVATTSATPAAAQPGRCTVVPPTKEAQLRNELAVSPSLRAVANANTVDARAHWCTFRRHDGHDERSGCGA